MPQPETTEEELPPPRADDDPDPSIENPPPLLMPVADDVVLWRSDEGAQQIEMRVVGVDPGGLISVQALEELEPPEDWAPAQPVEGEELEQWVPPDRPVFHGVVREGGVGNGTGFWAPVDA